MFVKMTGGGSVESGRANFGFNVQTTPTGLKVNRKNRGKASATDSPLQIRVKGNLDQILPSASGNGVEFVAPCTVRTLLDSSERVANVCRVLVVDNGQGKKASPDQFRLTIIDGPNAGYDSGSPNVLKGNITAHQDEN